MKKLFITILASFLLSSAAFAASFNIGATGALMTVEASGSETTGAGASGAANTNKTNVDNENVGVGSFFAEYASDYYGLTLGVEVTPGTADVSNKIKTRNDVEASKTGGQATTATARTFKANAEIENLQQIYVELPIYKSLFVRGGMAQLDVNTTEVASGNGGSYGNKTLDGTSFGIGLKGNYSANENIGFKLFYEETNFDTLNLTSTGNSVAAETNSIKADLDTQAIKFAVSYNF
jgi:hypothetical protein